MNNTSIIRTFDSSNRNITNINTLQQQIMTTIINRTLIFKRMMKKTIVTNYTLFAVATLNRIYSFS